MRQSPEDTDALRFVIDRMREGREAEMLGLLCFICEESTHLCKDCPHAHFVLSMYVAVRRSRMVTQKRFRVKRRLCKDYNLFKEAAHFRKEHEKFDRYARKSSDMLPSENLTTDESLNAELGISDNLNSLDEYIHDTEVLIRFLRARVLNNSDYFDDMMQVDLRKDYSEYFPRFNSCGVFQRFNESVRIYRPPY